MKNNQGKISISWAGKSVSGLVVIAGIIAMILGNFGIGVLLAMMGLGGAILMTAIIRGAF